MFMLQISIFASYYSREYRFTVLISNACRNAGKKKGLTGIGEHSACIIITVGFPRNY